MNLTSSVSNSVLADGVMFYVLIGVGFFAVFSMLMIFVFGYSMKDAGKDMGKVFIVLFASLAVPFSVRVAIKNSPAIIQPHADTMVSIRGLDRIPLENNSVLVSFTTSTAVVAYLEYTDRETAIIIPVLPTYSLEPRTEHSFIIDRVSQKGGTAYIVINGTRYGVDNKPIEIYGTEK